LRVTPSTAGAAEIGSGGTPPLSKVCKVFGTGELGLYFRCSGPASVKAGGTFCSLSLLYRLRQGIWVEWVDFGV
jgi:hypothetical protein